MLMSMFTKNHMILYNKSVYFTNNWLDCWPLFEHHGLNVNGFALEQCSSIEDNAKCYIGLEGLGHPCFS